MKTRRVLETQRVVSALLFVYKSALFKARANASAFVSFSIYGNGSCPHRTDLDLYSKTSMRSGAGLESAFPRHSNLRSADCETASVL